MSPSTGEGLGWLAGQEQADIIVFGSDYRTRRGHVAIGRSAQTLLEGGPAALALAPAEYAASNAHEIRTIGVLSGSADEAAIETAFSLAGRLDAKVVDSDRGVDLLVVGSRREAREGRVMITSRAQNAIEEATAPVLSSPAASRSTSRRWSPPDRLTAGRRRARRPGAPGQGSGDKPEPAGVAPNPADLFAPAGYRAPPCERWSSPICTSAAARATTCCACRRPALGLLEALDGGAATRAARRHRRAACNADPRRAMAHRRAGHASHRRAARRRPRGDRRARQPRRTAGPRVGAGPGDRAAAVRPRSSPGDASRALDRLLSWLAPARTRVSYPGVWLGERVWATHGHYLDHHLIPESAFGICAAATAGSAAGHGARRSPTSTGAAVATRESAGHAPVGATGRRAARGAWPS